MVISLVGIWLVWGFLCFRKMIGRIESKLCCIRI